MLLRQSEHRMRLPPQMAARSIQAELLLDPAAGHVAPAAKSPDVLGKATDLAAQSTRPPRKQAAPNARLGWLRTGPQGRSCNNAQMKTI